MLNKAILQGRLGADPELKQTANGISVCSFRIAVSRPNSRDGDRGTDWISIVAWRQTAEFISRYFTKGSMILVEGRIQVRVYTAHDGSKRTATEIVADRVYFCGGREQDSIPSHADEAQEEQKIIQSKYGQQNYVNQTETMAFTELSEYAYDDDLPF